MKDLGCSGRVGEKAALNEESGLQQEKKIGVWVSETYRLLFFHLQTLLSFYAFLLIIGLTVLRYSVSFFLFFFLFFFQLN
jgi:hypothetical protein